MIGVLTGAFLICALYYWATKAKPTGGENAEAGVRSKPLFMPEADISSPTAKNAKTTSRSTGSELPPSIKELPPEKKEEVRRAVYGIERSRAKHLGTWEFGGINQMMLQLNTPTSDEIQTYEKNLLESLTDGKEDGLRALVQAELKSQLRAVFECPFPIKLMTFNVPSASEELITFDIAFVAKEEDLTIDSTGTNPPSFKLAGGRASNLTEEDKLRYGHLFEIR
jgi:hypothetical protein